jgi:hypothetical protein
MTLRRQPVRLPFGEYLSETLEIAANRARESRSEDRRTNPLRGVAASLKKPTQLLNGFASGCPAWMGLAKRVTSRGNPSSVLLLDHDL